MSINCFQKYDGVAMQLVERDTELRALAEIATSSANLRGQIVVISGEAGIGKTTLLDTFVRQWVGSRSVLWGHCDDLLTPRPFGPIFDLAAYLGDRVNGLLRDGASGALLFPEILTALTALPSGSILIIEDAHWADHATIDLLRYIVRRLVTLRLMLVLTVRPDEISEDQGIGGLLGGLPNHLTTRLDIASLSLAGVTLLAKDKGVSPQSLYEATGGNPFFVSEVLAQPPQAGLTLPTSVRDAVVSRLNRLDGPKRALLASLSVVPEPLSLELIKSIFGNTSGDVCRLCIEKGLLVRTPDDKIRFRHELARICTLSTVPDHMQRDYHQRYLDFYSAQTGTASLSLLVHHAYAIGDGYKVLEAAPLAAADAAKIGAHHEAAAFLGLAKDHLELASSIQAAQILEDWAYEAALVLQLGDDVLDARHKAITLWQSLGRLDKVGLNLRWLWRLHWYRGETDEAKSAADQTIEILESIAPSKELGMAYSMRSQVYFLNSVHKEAILWGERALEIADQFGDIETRIHAMTNIATTHLLNGDHTARPMMEEALALSLQHGLHEHAARVYTNYAEYAILIRDWPLAEKVLTEGLAFDAKHNLQSWTYYLVGRQAQMHLDQGRLEEALAIACGALGVDKLTAVMRMPAMISLGVAQSRLGACDALDQLNQALALALELKEPQNIIPARFGLIEHFALQADISAAQDQLFQLIKEAPDCFSPWDSAQTRIWGHRLGVRVPVEFGLVPIPAQALELHGDFVAALATHLMIGTPMEAVFVALFAPHGHAPTCLTKAAATCEQIGSPTGSRAIRERADVLGLANILPKTKRGPYKAVKNHPLGLSAKEVEVLGLMIEGANNPEIAAKVNRSRRTIEHHVSAILGKMGVTNRLEAILRALSEPWIVAS
jgi:DNA-binding CsgD family transcriptional regulator/tetratricopeptide (TPR) repeat protein